MEQIQWSTSGVVRPFVATPARSPLASPEATPATPGDRFVPTSAPAAPVPDANLKRLGRLRLFDEMHHANAQFLASPPPESQPQQAPQSAGKAPEPPVPPRPAVLDSPPPPPPAPAAAGQPAIPGQPVPAAKTEPAPDLTPSPQRPEVGRVAQESGAKAFAPLGERRSDTDRRQASWEVPEGKDEERPARGGDRRVISRAPSRGSRPTQQQEDNAGQAAVQAALGGSLGRQDAPAVAGGGASSGVSEVGAITGTSAGAGAAIGGPAGNAAPPGSAVGTATGGTTPPWLRR